MCSLIAKAIRLGKESGNNGASGKLTVDELGPGLPDQTSLRALDPRQQSVDPPPGWNPALSVAADRQEVMGRIWAVSPSSDSDLYTVGCVRRAPLSWLVFQGLTSNEATKLKALFGVGV